MSDLNEIKKIWDNIDVPQFLSKAEPYVRKMHKFPFSDYENRVRKLTSGGDVVLDAGSGTATWSFAFANIFKQVIAVDKNRPRVDFARWLVKKGNIDQLSIEYGDVTDLDLSANSVDFVFCYGVVISYLPLRKVLREFHRVAKPGAEIYVCLNGIGWSYYLRDERGQINKKLVSQGNQGIFNSLCQSQQSELNISFSKLRHLLANESEANKILSGTDLSLQNFELQVSKFNKLLRPTVPKGIKNLFFKTNKKAHNNTAFKVCEAFDHLLKNSKLDHTPLVETLQIIENECGKVYGNRFAQDVINLYHGNKDCFSYATAGRGYSPEEVEAICTKIGFTDFKWAGEGDLVGYTGKETNGIKFFESEIDGKLGVWEFMVKKT